MKRIPLEEERPQAYIVQTMEDYERPTLVEVHLEKVSAERRASDLNAYALIGPEFPSEADCWDDYKRALAVWQSEHPLGDEARVSDRYGVITAPLAAGR